MESEDDAERVARCVRGDVEAFEPLVTRYQRVLFNVALRMTGNAEDARDATQTAFVKAYEKLGTYDGSHKFFSWIYRILVNECLNLLERRKPQEAIDPDLAAPEALHDELQAQELSERVQGALMRLPAGLREVVILRHFAELSYREISSVLSIPEKTVKSRLFSARQRLGEFLRDCTP